MALKFHKRLAAELKKVCWSRKKEKSNCRILLEDAMLVLRLRKRVLDEQDSVAGQHELWYHPGFLNFTTWNFTMHRLMRDDEGERQSDGSECICVKSVCLSPQAPGSRACFLTSLEMFVQDIDFSSAYCMDLFRMDNCVDMLAAGRMRLGYIRLQPVKESEADGPTSAVDVWHGRDHEESAARRAAPRASGPRRPSGAPRGGRPSKARRARNNADGNGNQGVDAGDMIDAPVDIAAVAEQPEGAVSQSDASETEFSDSDVAADDGDQGSDSGNYGGSDASSIDSNESEIMREMFLQLDAERRAEERESREVVSGHEGENGSQSSSTSSSNGSSGSSSSNDSSSSSETLTDEEEGEADAVDNDQDPAARMVRAAAVRELVFPLPEARGEIHFSFSGSYLRAHCWTHGDACRRQRTVRASDALGREGQGRPIGLLMSWLRRANTVASADEHVAMRAASFSQHERMEARAYFYSLPNGQAWAEEHERRRRSRETDEPRSVP